MKKLELGNFLLELEEGRDAHYATSGSVGMDVGINEEVTLKPYVPRILPTGLTVKDYLGSTDIQLKSYLQIVPRSGLFGSYGVMIPNSPGIIDPDYRGEIYIQVVAFKEVTLKPGTLAQIVWQSTLTSIDAAVKLKRPRGTGGFGSTDTDSAGSGTYFKGGKL